ncbi:MAG: hypothetical protein II119_03155, partial [Bacilli bacterium]|nr:hypothetical protein [Bacilli bacterium]
NGKINIEMRLFKPATEIKVEESSKESVHKDAKSSMDVISDVKTKKAKSKLLSRIKSFFNPDMTSLTDAEKFKKLDTASNIERINLIVSMKDPSYIEKSIVKLVGLEDKLRVIELLPSEDLKMVAIKKLSSVVPVKRLSQKEFGYLDKDGKYPITYDGKTDTIVIPNDFNKYGESLLSKYETQLSYIARRWGMTSTEVQELFNQKIKEFIDDGIFGRRVKASTISRLLDSGVIYNQFQTGTSQGKNDPYTRIDIEQRVLGVDMFMNAGNRPIYGMVLPEISKDTMEHIFGDKAPGKWYSGTDGCILIFDKDAIIRSTTFTLGDSLNFDANVVASSAIDPKFFGFGESILMEKVRSMSKEQFIKSKLTDIFYDNKDNDYDDHYIELQIHGLDSHSLSFVKEIVFKDTPLPYIQNRLKELGISWRVVE